MEAGPPDGATRTNADEEDVMKSKKSGKSLPKVSKNPTRDLAPRGDKSGNVRGGRPVMVDEGTTMQGGTDVVKDNTILM
jgi:hypothetical protein